MAKRSFIDYLLNPGSDAIPLANALRAAIGVEAAIAAGLSQIADAIEAVQAGEQSVAAMIVQVQGIIDTFEGVADAATLALTTLRDNAQTSLNSTADAAIAAVNDARDDAVDAAGAAVATINSTRNTAVATIGTAVTDAQTALNNTGDTIEADLLIIKADTQELRNEAQTARDEAVGAAASVDLPSIMPGDAGKSLVVDEDENGFVLVDGVGLPAGGAAGQYLRKSSSNPQDAAWSDLLEATESQKGIIELATTAEAVAAVDDLCAMTPKKTRDFLGGFGLTKNADPERNFLTLKAPPGVGFIDNVLGIQNTSDYYPGTGGAGNAAINFLDRNGAERAAIGYSRNSDIDPVGYYADTLYLEIGNPFAADDAATEFRVTVTHGPQSVQFPSAGFTQWVPVHVSSVTGDIYFKNGPTLGQAHFGAPSDVMRASFGLENVNGWVGEVLFANTFGMFTNMDAAGVRTDTTKPSWIAALGHYDDCWKLARKPPGGANNPLNVPELMRHDATRLMVGQTSTSPGADGRVSVTAPSGIPAITARAPQLPLLAHTSSDDPNPRFQVFGSGVNYIERGSITFNTGAGVMSFNTTSDYRAKDVYGDVESPVERLLALRPRRGKMHGATDEMDFFVAHELQEVVPSAVTGHKDAVDEVGEPVFQQVDKTGTLPLIVAALQEALKTIEAMKERIAVLEAGSANGSI